MGDLGRDHEAGVLIHFWFDATKSVGGFKGEGKPRFESVGVWRTWFRSHRCDWELPPKKTEPESRRRILLLFIPAMGEP